MEVTRTGLPQPRTLLPGQVALAPAQAKHNLGLESGHALLLHPDPRLLLVVGLPDLDVDDPGLPICRITRRKALGRIAPSISPKPHAVNMEILPKPAQLPLMPNPHLDQVLAPLWDAGGKRGPICDAAEELCGFDVLGRAVKALQAAVLLHNSPIVRIQDCRREGGSARSVDGVVDLDDTVGETKFPDGASYLERKEAEEMECCGGGGGGGS